MTQYAYAKQVPGGWHVASITGGDYLTPDLPKTCERTDLPVLVVSENVDRIIAIRELAKQKLQLLVAKVKKAVSEFSQEGEQTARNANLDKTPESENQALAMIYAASAVADWIADEFLPFHNSSDAWARKYERKMNSLCINAARKAGHQVREVRGHRDRLIEELGKLIGDCGDPNCTIHGKKHQAEPQNGEKISNGTVQIKEEEDPELVQFGELGGEAG